MAARWPCGRYSASAANMDPGGRRDDPGSRHRTPSAWPRRHRARRHHRLPPRRRPPARTGETTRRSGEQGGSVRENPNTLDSVDPKICPKRFEVKLVSDPGRRMEGQKTFVQALEKLAPEFYTQVGQHLRTWIPSAPRVGNTPASNESSGVVKTAGETGGESFGGEGRRTEGGDGPGAEDLHGPDEHGGHTAEGASSPEPTSGPATLN